MTYSKALKAQLCRAGEKDKSGEAAECYGMLLFGREFSSYRIALSTEHTAVAARAQSLLEAVLSIRPRLTRPGDGTVNHISLDAPADRARVLDFYGHSGTRPPLRINLSNLEDENAARAFVRGAFLSAGSMSEPSKQYHLEFTVYAGRVAEDFSHLLGEFGLTPHIGRKGAVRTVYFRDSTEIEDILTFMGAPEHAMELMNLKIYKDFRNVANRRANCETANISRTVDAAARQNDAIRTLREDGRFEGLPEELQEVALLRLMNPEMSLTEMADACKISRSGVSHRLNRLLRIAQEEPD